MPHSLPYGREKAIEWVLGHVPPSAATIDVGAGSGTYGKSLGNHLRDIDAVEVHAPYIDQFKLRRIYRRVLVGDVRDFTPEDFRPYQFAILGDVIEHLTADDARRVLSAAADVEFVLICVPYMLEQGAVDGVESERHLQPDLTHAIFGNRFSGFQRIALMQRKDGEIAGGYYVRG